MKVFNWFYALLWLTALTSLAEMLRNSLQGLFTRLAGIDEENVARTGIGALGHMLGGVTNAFSQSASGSNTNLRNIAGMVYGQGQTGGLNTRPSGIDGNIMGTNANATASGGINRNTSQTTSQTQGQAGTSFTNIGGQGQSEANVGGNSGINQNAAQTSQVANDLTGRSLEQDKYNQMFVNNLHGMSNTRVNPGKIAGGALNKWMGHTYEGAALASGIGSQISGVHNFIQTGKALKMTAKQISEESGGKLTEKEAMAGLVNSKDNKFITGQAGTNFNAMKIMAGHTKNFQAGEKVIANLHPYTRANFNPWRT